MLQAHGAHLFRGNERRRGGEIQVHSCNNRETTLQRSAETTTRGEGRGRGLDWPQIAIDPSTLFHCGFVIICVLLTM